MNTPKAVRSAIHAPDGYTFVTVDLKAAHLALLEGYELTGLERVW